jgi:hypothetical protein
VLSCNLVYYILRYFLKWITRVIFLLYIYVSYLFYFKDNIYIYIYYVINCHYAKYHGVFKFEDCFQRLRNLVCLLILVEFCHLRAAAKNEISQCRASNPSSSQTDIIIPWVHASQSAEWIELINTYFFLTWSSIWLLFIIVFWECDCGCV